MNKDNSKNSAGSKDSKIVLHYIGQADVYSKLYLGLKNEKLTPKATGCLTQVYHLGADSPPPPPKILAPKLWHLQT